MNTIDEYIYGKKVYAELLSNLRNQFKHLFNDFNIDNEGGIIGVNSHVERNKQLYMQVFPLCIDTCLINIPEQFQEKIIKTINRSRPYNVFFHYENIHNWKKLTSLDHYIISFDKDKFIKSNSNYYDIKSKIKWGEISKLSEDSDTDVKMINLWDLLYFKQTPSDFLAIPLPILSTPTILVVIKNNIPEDIKNDFIREVYFRTRETVNLYVYNRLITNLTELINSTENIVNSKDHLDKLYISELSKVLLPVSYRFKGKQIKFTDVWPLSNGQEKINSTLTLDLMGSKVVFALTSFHFPRSRRSKESVWIHELGSFALSLPNTKSMLENIYALIKGQWDKAMRVKLSAKKTAITSIMTRNISHNIGSHVLEKIVREKEVDNEEIKKLLSFLQTRMEFIADISTSQPLISRSMHLIKEILGGFFPIKNSKLRTNNNQYPAYLLKYITGSSDVSFDMKAGRYNINFDYPDEDVAVDIPNELLGSHALYIILENLIRNAVKHSVIPKVGSRLLLNFKIIVEEDNSYPDYYRLRIIDNLGEANKIQRASHNFTVLEDNKEKKAGFTDYINNKLNAPILHQNELRVGNWGMLELKICAAYLRKVPLHKIDDYNDENKDTSNPPIIRAAFFDDDNKESTDAYNLGYEIYLLKPKLAVFLNFPVESNVVQVKKAGVEIRTTDKDSLKSILLKGTEHQFLVLPSKYKGHSIKSNQKVLFFDQKDVDELILFLQEDKPPELFLNRKYSKHLKIQDAVISNDIKSTSQDRLVVLDHHGDLLKSHANQLNPADFRYYEIFSSQSPSYFFFRQLKNQSAQNDSILFHEMIQAANLKIAILDERIQESSMLDDPELLKLKDEHPVIDTKLIRTLSWMNIFVPSINEFNLSANDYNTIRDKLEAWINQQVNSIDYLVLHMGVLEKYIGSTDQEKISKWKEDFEAAHKAKIIFISGRGLPSNLPKYSLYLPFTLFNQYLINNRSKIYLTKLIHSLRPRY